ncbi:gamma-glutamyl-gamma-aminobutyrate hydrolase family protein [Patescibacteria group bacterium]|nr:gamma-glutamyl-gamma-aminobutyrate hydrolase family protein [Patescibacteria group bacterium]
MKVAIVDNNTKNLTKIKKLLKGCEILVLSLKEFKTNLVKNYNLVILTGGSGIRPVLNNSKYYKNEIDFIKKTKKPVIGICLGAQIIASAAGCKLKKLSTRVQGIENVEINKNFYKKNKIKVYESHRFSIMKASKKIEVLACSLDGIEIFKHKGKNIYGIQFHPEVLVPKNDGKKLFDYIFKLISSTPFS